jgi:hypothetical protein
MWSLGRRRQTKILKSSLEEGIVHESVERTQVAQSRIQQRVVVDKEMKIQDPYKGINIFD